MTMVSFSDIPLPSPDVTATAITAGPGGNLWFTESAIRQIVRVSTGGAVNRFPLSSSFSTPSGITAGPDGNLWFTESTSNKIGQITTHFGAITEFDIPTIFTGAEQITAGP